MYLGSRPLFHENFPSISRFQLEIQVEIQLELHFSFFDGLQSLFANRDPVTTFFLDSLTRACRGFLLSGEETFFTRPTYFRILSRATRIYLGREEDN